MIFQLGLLFFPFAFILSFGLTPFFLRRREDRNIYSKLHLLSLSRLFLACLAPLVVNSSNIKGPSILYPVDTVNSECIINT